MKEKSDSIVITFPVQFLLDISPNLSSVETTTLPDNSIKVHYNTTKDKILAGYKECIRQVEEVMKNPDEQIWYHKIGNKPTQEILYAYITVLGHIRWRAKVVKFDRGYTKEFGTIGNSRKVWAKYWLVLCDFIKAPEAIPFKGCQGFRYTEKLF